MSLVAGNPLPLPNEPQSVANVPDMHTAWEALVRFSWEVQNVKCELDRNAAPMLLALKSLGYLISKADVRADPATKDELARTATALQTALQWVSPWF